METWKGIYDFCKGAWKGGLPETVCGSGSTLKNTLVIIKILNKIINIYDIKSIADIGCGDLNWMKKVNLSGVNYTGYDWILRDNMDILGNKNITFVKGNVANIDILKADLVICKDVMIHMSNERALEILNNIKRSSPKYLFITTFDIDNNIPRMVMRSHSCNGSNYSPLNIELEPFNITGSLYRIKLASNFIGGNKYFNLYKLND